jgi:hypothetical protein
MGADVVVVGAQRPQGVIDRISVAGKIFRYTAKARRVWQAARGW